MQRRLTPYLFVLPFTVAFLLFLVLPVGYALGLSVFQLRHQGLGPDITVFAPIANYVRAFTDSTFLTSLVNIARFAVIQVPVMIVLAVVIALILDAGSGRLQRFFRLAVFLPYAVPGVIAGLLWSFLYSANVSPINQWLHSLGLPIINFIDPSIILGSVANIIVWVVTGYNAIILYAALRNVSRELYDAAEIDGASRWQVIRYIKLPLLRPSLTLVAIFSIIGSTQIFNEPFMLRSLGYVASSVTPSTVIYEAATRDQDYNYGSALAISLGVITAVASVLFLRIANRERKA